MMKQFPYKIIDLSHTLHSAIPTWNGECGFTSEIKLDYDQCTSDVQFRVMSLCMNAGIGTHMDAPSHCVPGARSIHELTVSELCMPAIVIDVSAKSHALYSIISDDIYDFENQHGLIPAKSCVFFNTGWGKFWNEPEKYRNDLNFPSVAFETAQLLLERRVHALGVDTLSPDRPDDGFKVHKAFLEKNRLLIENVANLDAMPPIGAFIMALPLKIKDATESPIRLIGLIERT